MFRKHTAAVSFAIVVALATGCVAVVPYTPNTDLVTSSNREQVQSDMRELVLRAKEPQITGLEFNDQTITIKSQAQHIGMFWQAVTSQLVNDIHLPSLQRAEVYENHYVYLYGPGDRLLIKVLFTDAADAQKFCDMMFSLKEG
jgi:hypothetical protein